MKISKKLFAVCHADSVNGHIVEFTGFDQTQIAHYGLSSRCPPHTLQGICTIQNIT